MCDLDSIPDALREQTRERCQSVISVAGRALQDHPDLLSVLPRVTCCSRFVAETAIRDPESFAELVRSGRLLKQCAPDEENIVATVTGAGDEAEQMKELRRIRRTEMLRIAWRDLAGWADLDETLTDLSLFADACLRAALVSSTATLNERCGHALDHDGQPQTLIIVAMGKLGGNELNFSSDIDLVFLYPEAGETSGPRVLSNEEYFTRLVRRLIRMLDTATGDGFVFRVDARLRPFGKTGALVYSLAAFESYLQQHGRDWERYAYVKARPVTGSERAHEALHGLMRPFVYRRYLDYGVFESLRDMKELIEQEVLRRELENDIKLGPGGIREIEFIAQSLQLIRGGSKPQLQTRELEKSYAALKTAGLIEADAANVLLDAYRFLRRLENRLQALDDRQTHEVPRDEQDRQRIAFSMGFEHWNALSKELIRHRTAVSEQFAVAAFGPAGSSDGTDTFKALWVAGLDGDTVGEIGRAGYPDAERATAALEHLRNSRLYANFGKRGRNRLDALISPLVRDAASTPQPEETLERVLRIIEAVGRRTAYLALLNENPPVRERLVKLCGQSAYLADQIARHPLLLDELIDPRVFTELPQRDRLNTDLEERLSAFLPDDLENRMEALRQFQQAAMFRIAVADLADLLPLMRVSDRLTDVAELVLEQCVRTAEEHMRVQYGTPQCGDDLHPTGFAVIGYGKLGGIELGYESDLDLVFLHDSEGSTQKTSGPKIVDNRVYYARLGQRIIHLLSTPTASGRLYEVDMRLRPSGNAGLLVTSAQAFEHYQQNEAWTWEHQALLRARPVAGDTRVADRFAELRRKPLSQPRDTDRLRADVAQMRQRMLDESATTPAGQFDLKRDRGGITDVEFLVQYWILRHAHAEPDLLDWTDNIRQLETLSARGILRPDTADTLGASYRSYRQRLHRLWLDGAGTRVAATEFTAQRKAINALWKEVFEGIQVL
ncbi:MAG: bifunctional [glutamate--ammonia ligase]-adenylyl-L-tyrosine phosphorylase/[glutamate--ammonia-ligase] adenylyltransferase [Gammaproteobacteria bacterium]